MRWRNYFFLPSAFNTPVRRLLVTPSSGEYQEERRSASPFARLWLVAHAWPHGISEYKQRLHSSPTDITIALLVASIPRPLWNLFRQCGLPLTSVALQQSCFYIKQAKRSTSFSIRWDIFQKNWIISWECLGLCNLRRSDGLLWSSQESSPILHQLGLWTCSQANNTRLSSSRHRSKCPYSSSNRYSYSSSCCWLCCGFPYINHGSEQQGTNIDLSSRVFW